MVMNVGTVGHFDYCDHNSKQINFNHGPFFKFQIGLEESGQMGWISLALQLQAESEDERKKDEGEDKCRD